MLDTVAALERRLVGELGPSRVVSIRLFGSMARGTARVDSDVDVLVVSAQPHGSSIDSQVTTATPACPKRKPSGYS